MPDFALAERERQTEGVLNLLPMEPGMVDPLFAHELALELGMTVSELGSRMSAHELTVAWPAFFAYRAREAERQKEKEESRPRTFGR
jgi:hypothetical protein